MKITINVKKMQTRDERMHLAAESTFIIIYQERQKYLGSPISRKIYLLNEISVQTEETTEIKRNQAEHEEHSAMRHLERTTMHF